MNVHLIRENENQNDGSYIHLYRNKQIGAWCAYGYSAYGLRLFDKQQGYMNFRSYSDCLRRVRLHPENPLFHCCKVLLR